MFHHLFPSEGKAFFDLFEQHAAKTLEGARLLREMLTRPQQPAEQAMRIREVETEGDVITHRAVETLHRTFVTPFDRGDIHRLITRLDDILDLIEATAERFWLYKIDEADTDAIQLAEVLVQAVSKVNEAMRGLRNLKERERLIRICTDINSLENESDTLVRCALGRLFSGSKDPVSIIKWKDIYDFLEDAVDRCEDVANVVEGVALEYS